MLQIHDVAELALRWVTTAGPSSVVARQLLSARGLVRGELSAEKLARGYHDLRAAIYDGRVETYASPPLLEALSVLEVNEETGRVEAPPAGSALEPTPGGELTDAVAGVVYVLATRRDSWRSPRTRPRNLHRPRGLHRPSAIR